jgi:hypothetical protein
VAIALRFHTLKHEGGYSSRFVFNLAKPGRCGRLTLKVKNASLADAPSLLDSASSCTLDLHVALPFCNFDCEGILYDFKRFGFFRVKLC